MNRWVNTVFCLDASFLEQCLCNILGISCIALTWDFRIKPDCSSSCSCCCHSSSSLSSRSSSCCFSMLLPLLLLLLVLHLLIFFASGTASAPPQALLSPSLTAAAGGGAAPVLPLRGGCLQQLRNKSVKCTDLKLSSIELLFFLL